MSDEESLSISRRIIDVLPNNSANRTRDFLREAIVYIEAMRRRTTARPTNKEILYEIDRIYGNAQKCIYNISEITSSQLYLSDIYGSIDSLSRIRLKEECSTIIDEKALAITKIQNESIRATQALNSILESLDNFKAEFPTKSGTPKADSHGFVKALALAYKKFIGEPSSYPEGPFATVVRIALEAAGLPHADPSRKIKAALAFIDETEK